jgi:hypothetical protein
MKDIQNLSKLKIIITKNINNKQKIINHPLYKHSINQLIKASQSFQNIWV